ncbi:glycosyltransferase [candidate division KSB3 bacterium]|uniref:Glycosyltransferase n=1 Tax=candidate division KSB3 bacterium TaxID=2044937 RepID=A0A9D5JSD4_9BACT|nr:glycosyltransferase [candidate division KSB3 bacterium]MBD3323318.1 glycosyltransferase [candidate division KSB3 bacterium]
MNPETYKDGIVMKILMIAPEPFFQPRGTPFSEYHRLRALSKLGHTVDLLTYPVGEDVDIENVTIYRSLNLPFVKHVKIGPSLIKIFLDIPLFLQALWMALTRPYDCLHTHEEAVVVGAVLRKFFGYPHVYDMHSSLPEQMSNFGISRSRLLFKFGEFMERWVLKHSSRTIVICPYLGERVQKLDRNQPYLVIENVPVTDDSRKISPEDVERLRQRLGMGGQTVILYTGTMEAYQGIDLLLESAKHVSKQEENVRYVLVGGHPEQIEHMQELARLLGVDKITHFLGQQPVEDMPLYMQLADILVSPRKDGKNTPLKIYSYLKSGKPIVATNLLTHTQVLHDDVAVLAENTAEAFAEGTLKLLHNPLLRTQLAANALRLSQEKYSYEAYLEKTAQVYRYVEESLKR